MRAGNHTLFAVDINHREMFYADVVQDEAPEANDIALAQVRASVFAIVHHTKVDTQFNRF
jgi:hypothetical protein